jgi:hypothetical protein
MRLVPYYTINSPLYNPSSKKILQGAIDCVLRNSLRSQEHAICPTGNCCPAPRTADQSFGRFELVMDGFHYPSG